MALLCYTACAGTTREHPPAPQQAMPPPAAAAARTPIIAASRSLSSQSSDITRRTKPKRGVYIPSGLYCPSILKEMSWPVCGGSGVRLTVDGVNELSSRHGLHCIATAEFTARHRSKLAVLSILAKRTALRGNTRTPGRCGQSQAGGSLRANDSAGRFQRAS